MSDPYNSADFRAGKDQEAEVAKPVPSRVASRSHIPRSESLPFWRSPAVWNFAALVLLLIWVGTRRSVTASSLAFFSGPLILAFITSCWIANQTVANVVRFINAGMAALTAVKLIRLAGTGFYTNYMMVAFVCSLLIPTLNAIFLKPRRED